MHRSKESGSGFRVQGSGLGAISLSGERVVFRVAGTGVQIQLHPS
jgi:hypothetical protein